MSEMTPSSKTPVRNLQHPPSMDFNDRGFLTHFQSWKRAKSWHTSRKSPRRSRMTSSPKYNVSIDFENGGLLLKKLSKYKKRALNIFVRFFQGIFRLIEVLFN